MSGGRQGGALLCDKVCKRLTCAWAYEHGIFGENGLGYGDDPTNPVNEWTPLADDGATTISIVGNMLEDDVGFMTQVGGNLTFDDLGCDYLTGSGEFVIDAARAQRLKIV